MLLRVLVASLLALVTSTLTVVSLVRPSGRAPSPTRPRCAQDAVTREGLPDAALTVSLERPADSVVAYWRGNPHADIRLAFSPDGTTFGPAEPAGRDEIGSARKDGTTYGALHSVQGAVAVRVTTDRPVARLTVLGLSDGPTQKTTQRSSAGLSLAAGAATTEPTVLARGAWGADPAYMSWSPEFYATKKLVVHHTDTSG